MMWMAAGTKHAPSAGGAAPAAFKSEAAFAIASSASFNPFDNGGAAGDMAIIFACGIGSSTISAPAVPATWGEVVNLASGTISGTSWRWRARMIYKRLVAEDDLGIKFISANQYGWMFLYTGGSGPLTLINGSGSGSFSGGVSGATVTGVPPPHIVILATHGIDSHGLKTETFVSPTLSPLVMDETYVQSVSGGQLRAGRLLPGIETNDYLVSPTGTSQNRVGSTGAAFLAS